MAVWVLLVMCVYGSWRRASCVLVAIACAVWVLGCVTFRLSRLRPFVTLLHSRKPTTIPLTPPVLYVITVSDRRGAHAMASSRGFLETFTSEKRNIQSHFMLSSQLTSRKGGNTPDCLPQVPPQVRFHRGGIMRIFHVMLVPARRRGLLSSRRASAQSCVDRPRRQPILRQGARTHPTPNPPSFTLTLLPARQGTCILRYSRRTLK